MVRDGRRGDRDRSADSLVRDLVSCGLRRAAFGSLPSKSAYAQRLPPIHGARGPTSPFASSLLHVTRVFGVLLLSTISGYASAEDCKAGEENRLVLLGWQAEASPRGQVLVFQVRSNLPKAIRSVNAVLIFEVDGKEIAQVALNPGLKLNPGQVQVAKETLFEELASATDTITAWICVRHVEYTDGTYDDF